MKTLPSPLALATLATLAAALAASAQTLPPAPAPKPADEAVQLSVFEVTAEKDLGYAASSAMTGTRTGPTSSTATSPASASAT